MSFTNHVMRSEAEKRAILKEYDAAPKGEKLEILGREGIRYSHIYAWRKKFAPKRRRKKANGK